jgi:hypothetical protein
MVCLAVRIPYGTLANLLEKHTYSGGRQELSTKIRTVMRNLLPPLVCIIYTEYFKNSAQHKPSQVFRYFEETFLIFYHGPKQLQNFLSQRNSLRHTIQFTLEIKSDSAIPFLDALASGMRRY